VRRRREAPVRLHRLQAQGFVKIGSVYIDGEVRARTSDARLRRERGDRPNSNLEEECTMTAKQQLVGKLLLAVGLSVAAIAAAPLVMGPSYAALQPRLGPLTVIVVEVLYALFIDFPLAAAYVAIITIWQGPRRNPARSALGFVTLYFGLILLCIALAPTSDLLAYWALADTFPSAMAEAVAGLGAPTVGLLVASFVVFDLLLCSAAGVVADALLGRKVRVPSGIQELRDDEVERHRDSTTPPDKSLAE
jgi:hypothetical protein